MKAIYTSNCPGLFHAMTLQIRCACVLFLLIATAFNTSADPSPTPPNGSTTPKPSLTTDDGRYLLFSIQAYGSGQVFQVGVGSSGDDAPKLKRSDVSVELLDQDGKPIAWVPLGEGFGFAGSVRSGTASVSYKLLPDGSQIPTAVNFAWRGGKTRHIILTPNNFHHF